MGTDNLLLYWKDDGGRAGFRLESGLPAASARKQPALSWCSFSSLLDEQVELCSHSAFA